MIMQFLSFLSAIDQPVPDFNAPGIPTLARLGSYASAVLLAGGVLGIIVGGILIISGSLSHTGPAKTKGFKVVAWSIVGVIFGGSAAAIISWSTGLPVFS